MVVVVSYFVEVSIEIEKKANGEDKTWKGVHNYFKYVDVSIIGFFLFRLKFPGIQRAPLMWERGEE